MTAPLTHSTSVQPDGQLKNGTEVWRGVCTCGWKTARYTQLMIAARLASGHVKIVRAGQWRGALPALVPDGAA